MVLDLGFGTSDLRVYSVGISPPITTMETQMEQNTENDMEAGILQGFTK